jgi:hypothetical protein
MAVLCGLILVTGLYPLWRAFQAERGSSLAFALLWAAAAWAAWTAAVWTWAVQGWAATAAVRYLAFALTGCASVAVLGARRPGAGPWNFVVAGLLAVLLLPIAYGLGRPRPEAVHVAFLAGTVAVGVINSLEAAAWLDPQRWGGEPELPAGPFLAGLAPWLGLLQMMRAGPPNEFDRLWLRFRDRFGLVWGQRLREQFNRAAANAGWPVVLRWGGLRRLPGTPMPEPAVQEQIVAVLRALLTRFETEGAQ